LFITGGTLIQQRSGKSARTLCTKWPIGSRENHWNCCHEMSDFNFKAECTKFDFRWAYSAPQTP